MKTMKKVFVTLSLLFTYLSTCNNGETELIKANAETEATPPDLIFNAENKLKLPMHQGFLLNDNIYAKFNEKFVDKNIVNCVVTNNKNTLLSFDAVHNSNISEGYPQEIGVNKELAIRYFITDGEMDDFQDGVDVFKMTEQEAEEQINMFPFELCSQTKSPIPSTSNVSFVLGAYLYENLEDPNKNDLIIYADADGIVLEWQMFKNFENLKSIDFEGCYSLDGSMKNMFQNCTSLTNIDLSGINFQESYTIVNNDMSLFTCGTSSFEGMFEGCISLEEVNFPNLPYANGEKVVRGDLYDYVDMVGPVYYDKEMIIYETNYSSMFKNCTNLQRVNLNTDYISVVNNEIAIDSNEIRTIAFPFAERLFEWDGKKTTNEIYTTTENGVEINYISENNENLTNIYRDMFVGCNNLNIVALPNYASLIGYTPISYTPGIFVLSNVMADSMMVGNVCISQQEYNKMSPETFELFKEISSVDTCSSDSETVNRLVETYESIVADPERKSELFFLSTSASCEFNDNMTIIYITKTINKLNYMRVLYSIGNKTAQNNLITSIISNDYNIFIIIGFLFLISIGSYYLIKKKQFSN